MTNKKTEKYAKVGGRDLELDIFLPENIKSTHTAVILLHGGAWRMGDKSMMEMFGKGLARHGFVALAPAYRLLVESPWPSQLEDVKAYIQWTRANAKSLAIHPDKIVVQGFSAGGHLALMAGGTPNSSDFIGKGGNEEISDRVAAVIAFFPPIELRLNPPSADFIDHVYKNYPWFTVPAWELMTLGIDSSILHDPAKCYPFKYSDKLIFHDHPTVGGLNRSIVDFTHGEVLNKFINLFLGSFDRFFH